MAAEAKITAQDKKDLDKFTKFLTLKSIQVIVQSRLGDKINTKSKPQSTGSDWFNLAIKDNPEVLSEAKKHISNQLPSIGNSLCVEISLKTSEGDGMILETWCLGINERSDSQAKVHYAVYNKMALLLKSLICVCRVTPAYRLSRKQGQDFGIYYRMYYGGVDLISALGEGFENIRVGSVITPIGTITLTAAYRTKLAIPDRPPSSAVPMAVKDDHFVETNPKVLSARPCQYLSSGSSEREDIPTCVLESQDSCATTFSTSPSSSGYVQSPQRDSQSHQHTTPPINVTTYTRGRPVVETEKHKLGLPESGSFSSGHKRGAFVATGKSPPDEGDIFSTDIPFMSLLQDHSHSESPKNKTLAAVRRGSVDQPGEQTTSTGSNKSNSSQTSAPDDFVMVELKPAFAKSNSGSDLGAFYRECQTAPPLLTFNDDQSFQEPNTEEDTLVEQLADYEDKMTDFDDFVKSLQDDCSDSSS
ncbi:autophagy-related protein 13-like isoform X1 [Glandiceps talaboti]